MINSATAVSRHAEYLLKRRRKDRPSLTVDCEVGAQRQETRMAGEWPEGFRLDPNARWNDEIRRLSETANADVVFQLAERRESAHECATRCPNPATRNLTVSTPDKLAQVSVDLCEGHYQAALSDRDNATQGLEVKREFSDDGLGGDPERVRRLAPVITSPDLSWKSVDLVDLVREPIDQDPPELGYEPGD
jgi:hypothetical protein